MENKPAHANCEYFINVDGMPYCAVKDLYSLTTKKNDDMSKTIEELAKQYAEHQTDEQGYGSMEAWKQDVAIYYDDAKEVLSWLFAKPLRNRLTAEEKDRVRKEYSNTYPLDPDCGVANILIQGVLERIFGKEFFKEDKE